MTTHQFGDITLEEFKPREWRAWRSVDPRKGVLIGDQRRERKCIHVKESGHGLWEEIPDDETCGYSSHHDYRRPVPLPSIDSELVDACQFAPGKWSFEHWMYRDDDGRAELVKMLKHRLPGYEEQLAKEHGGMNLSVSKEWCEKRFVKESDVDITAGTGDTPVPADGWRTIESAYPWTELSQSADVHAQHPGASLLDYFAGRALQGMMAYPGDSRSGSWNNNASHEGAARTAFDLAQAMVVESARRKQPLPAPPQEKGGEA